MFFELLSNSGDVECAGINRRVVENERVLQERRRDPSWPWVLRSWSWGQSRSVDRGTGRREYELRKPNRGRRPCSTMGKAMSAGAKQRGPRPSPP